MNSRKRSGLPWMVLLMGCISSPLWAADCSISTSAVNFGNYDPVSNVSATANGTVTVTCGSYSFIDVLVGFTVTTKLSTGLGGSYVNRVLKKGADSLSYNLFTDPGYSSVFGDGSSATSTVQICYSGIFAGCGGAPSGSSGTPFPVTVYGRIPAGQDVSVGDYSDSITATITF